MSRDIEVLHVEDCPNLAVLLERLESVTCGRATIRVTQVDTTVALPTGFAGSPTMLIDGQNPFGAPPEASLSCALRIPTVQELKEVLDE